MGAVVRAQAQTGADRPGQPGKTALCAQRGISFSDNVFTEVYHTCQILTS